MINFKFFMQKFIRILSALAVFILLNQQTFASAVFTDVASNHPHYTAITYLKENGVIEGYSDNTFRPANPVNRAEALKIILLGSDIIVPEIQPQAVFPDVLSEMWYAKYAAKAKNLNIVKGDDATGYFRPGDTVNLAEALKILILTNKIDPETPLSPPYADVPADAWFAPYFECARKATLFDLGPDEKVNPSRLVDRGLMAELMYRLATNPYIYQEGKASFYGEIFHGQTTASGDVYDASAFTAAHRTLPFNTIIRVTNKENGKSVLVRVNDRGPYGDSDRIIDLSKAAFQEIASISRGVINVTLEIADGSSMATGGKSDLSESASLSDTGSSASVGSDALNTFAADCPEKENAGTIDKDSFDNITLDADFPDKVIKDQVLTLAGTVDTAATEISAFTLNSKSEQAAFGASVVSKRFEVNVTFSETGKHQIGIVPGESGTSFIKDIYVLPSNCIKEAEDKSLTAPANLDIALKDGDSVISWDKSGYNIFRVTFLQGDKNVKFFVYNINSWRPYYPDFAGFEKGSVTLVLRGATAGQQLLNQSRISWSKPAIMTFNADSHYEYTIKKDSVSVSELTQVAGKGAYIRAKITPKAALRSKGAVIKPDGTVYEKELENETNNPIKNQNDISIFPPGDSPLTFEYRITQQGVHFLEINDAEGLAALNVPVYPEDTYPLLPNPLDLSDSLPVDLGGNLTKIRNDFLRLVNSDRSSFGLSPLVIDDKLNTLAQYRTNDMAANDYFSHWDAQGRDANDLRKNYAIPQALSENLAKDINLTLAEYGLMRSAIHRVNILNPEWTRVGFGITKAGDGSYIFVQLFSADPIDLGNLSGLRDDLLSALNKNRGIPLAQSDTLNNVAQGWSESMANRNFFSFTDPDGKGLVQVVRDAGVNETMGTYIAGNTSFDDAKTQLGENAPLQDLKWRKIGIGIKQDSVGLIKITLIYTE
jgi:rare lipoprotein A